MKQSHGEDQLTGKENPTVQRKIATDEQLTRTHRLTDMAKRE
jgi:hypothetical protein